MLPPDDAELLGRWRTGDSQARDRVPEGLPFRAYLLRIARNVLLHELRRRGRKPEPAALDESAFAGPSELSPSRVVTAHAWPPIGISTGSWWPDSMPRYPGIGLTEHCSSAFLERPSPCVPLVCMAGKMREMYPSNRMAREILNQNSKRDTANTIKVSAARVADPKHKYTKDEILEVMRAIVDSLDKLMEEGAAPPKAGSSVDKITPWVSLAAAAIGLIAAGMAKAMDEERQQGNALEQERRKTLLALEAELQKALALEEARRKTLALEDEIQRPAEAPRPNTVEDIGALSLTERGAQKITRKKTRQISEGTQGKEELRREAGEAPVERMQTKKGSRGEPSRRRRRPPLP